MGKVLENLIGKKYGMLTVIEQAESKKGNRRWLCKCDCGNAKTVTTASLTTGRTKSCGCIKFHDLTREHIGRLTVLGRSDRYGARGARKTPLWKCLCACGAITYKATDTLTNSEMNMCADCASKYAMLKMRESAGYVDGTQLSRIKSDKLSSLNTSGCRGVYYEKRSGLWRARLKFKGKLMNFGSFKKFDDAVKARKEAEALYFGEFISDVEKKEISTN